VRRLPVQELAGDGAARQLYHHGAVGQGRLANVNEHAGTGFVNDVLAAGEQLVVEDELVTQRELRVRVTDVVRLNELLRAEHHVKDECLRLGRAGPSRLRRDGDRHRASHA